MVEPSTIENKECFVRYACLCMCARVYVRVFCLMNLLTGLHAAWTLEINHYPGRVREQVISICRRVALRRDREAEQWDERGRLGAKVNIWSS